jgi:uncharacterized protein (TIRG00374 family)
VWLSLRGVPFREVGEAIARARWVLLLAISIPAYLALVWLRAARWRHLTDAVQPIPTPSLARAVCVGFMANNVFPLRMGEVVRCWYLARETGASTAALFGTVILERVLDAVCVLVLVLVVIAGWGGGSDGLLARGAVLLVPLALLPILFLLVLRARPEPVLALTGRLLRPFPERFSTGLQELLRRFSAGLGALRGGWHLPWIAVHSLLIWFLVAIVPIWAAFLALDIDFPTAYETVGAAWMTQAAVGAAVALPSAPGFFGIFHAACRFALERFGVEADTAVAAGTLIHAVMWITLTTLGLAVLRLRRTSLVEVDGVIERAEARSPGKGPSQARR